MDTATLIFMGKARASAISLPPLQIFIRFTPVAQGMTLPCSLAAIQRPLSCEDPKADVVVAIRRVVVVAIGTTQVDSRIVPTATTDHAVRASGQSPFSTITR